ncbi:MAG: ABC transporter ATP-binding protein [Pirellulaceae bacterium]|jgi:ABC-type multidrug transport system ATPase subunit
MQLEIRELSKRYSNGVQALDRVTLTIPQGMYGLLGPNGAGKSTLMRTVATLQEADSGEVRFGDIDVLKEPDRLRRVLGYLPQEFGVYPRTSATELLNHFAVLKGIGSSSLRKEVVEGLLHRVNLYEHRKKAVSSYSGGMRQRFGIAQALLGDPKLLIVDEPTAGLDPGERNRFYNLLAELGESIVVILSTHIVQDVKELCTQMAILDRGQLLYSGSPEEGESRLAGKIWSRSMSKGELDQIQQTHRVVSSKLVAGRPLVHVYSDQDPGEGFTQVEPDLEDLFFSTLQGVA